MPNDIRFISTDIRSATVVPHSLLRRVTVRFCGDLIHFRDTFVYIRLI